MNDRNLAIKISKHPLLRKLMEDKTIPNSIVARLIVEELTEVSSAELLEAEGIGRNQLEKAIENFKKSKDPKELNAFKQNLTQQIEKLAKNPEIDPKTNTGLKAMQNQLQTINNALGTGQSKTPSQRERGKKLIQHITQAKDIKDWMDRFKVSVDVFKNLHPEYWKKIGDHKIYLKDYEENVNKQLNNDEMIALFRDESKRQQLVDLIKKYNENTTSFGVGKPGREILIASLTQKMLEAYEGDPYADDDPFADEEQKSPAEEKIEKAIDNAKSTEELEKINKQVQDSNVSDETKEKTEKATKAKEDELEQPFNAQEIYEKGFDDAEKAVLKKFKEFVKKTETITEEAINIADALSLKKDTIGKFIQTLDNEKEVPVFRKIFAKIQKDQKLLKGVDWLFDQEQSEKEKSIENPYKDMAGYKELNLKPEEETVFVSFLDKLKESNIIKEANLTQLGQAIGTGRGLNDVIKSFEGDSKKILFKLLRRDDILNFIKSIVRAESPYSKLEGYKELNLSPEEETVFVSFLDKLKESNIIKEANLTQLGKMIGTGRGLTKIIKSFEPNPRKILIKLLQRDDVQEFLKANLKQIEKIKAPESDDTKDAPTAGPQLPINTENTDEFVKASSDFLKEFYRQKYKKAQAEFIKNVIDSLSGMVEDENLAQAAQRVPDKKEEPESDEATTENEPEETEQEEPEAIEEQEEEAKEEQKQASKDEMRNLRIGMNSLLKRINWSQKSLEAYEETAKAGSVLATADKKKFIKVLQDIQKAIRRICLVLQQILRDTQKLNEEESDTVKEWREIQKKYDLASEAVSNLAEILKPGGVKEIPKMLTNDAFSALIDLATHFPSVAPFGAGKDSRRDFIEYQVKFKNAVQKVKDDLQNVFSLMKTGQAGEESLILALDGLKEFSAHIQSIFGVPSEFEELKVEPNEEAAEGESQEDKEPEKEPEEEKEEYSDEMSEEDKQIINKLVKDHMEFYKLAVKTYKSMNPQDEFDVGANLRDKTPDTDLSTVELPDGTTAAPTTKNKSGGTTNLADLLQEILRKTESYVKELESLRSTIKDNMEKVKTDRKNVKRKKVLKMQLKRYISIYEELADADMRQDYSSVLDSTEQRLEKIRDLLNLAKRYMTEKQPILSLFQSIIKGEQYLDAKGKPLSPQPTLEEIHEALKDADGKEAERLTGDMQFKIDRAEYNLKNIFKGQMDLSKADFSGFKKIVGFVADKISKASIQLRNKINEEEEEDIEIQPTEQDIERASQEKKEDAAKSEEIKKYKNDFSTALEEMKDFTSVFHTFMLAMKKAEEDEVETLMALDEDFTVVKGQLALMDDRLDKVQRIFNQEISLIHMKEYGFPPKGTEKPSESSSENPYKELEGYTKLNLKPKEETVFISFLEQLKKSNIIKEANLTQLGKIIGTGKGLSKIIKSFKDNDRKILIKLLQRDDVQEFLKANLKEIEKIEQPTSGEKQSKKPTFTDEQKDQEELFDYIVKALEEVVIFQDKIQEITRDWTAGYEDDAAQKLDPFEKPERTDVKRIAKTQDSEQFVRSKLTRFTYGKDKELGRALIKQVIKSIENYASKKKMKEEDVFRVAEYLFERDDVLDYFKSRLRKGSNKEKPIGTSDPENRKKSSTDEEDLSFNRDVQEQIANKLKPLIREMLNKGK